MTTVWFSLRRRLLGLLLGGVTAAWMATMLFSYVDAHHEVDALFDAQLAQVAQSLLALARHETGDAIEDLGDAGHKYQRGIRFQIWRSDGKLVMRSKNAPDTPLTATAGFSEASDESGHWRHFSQWNSERSLQVQVSEDHQIRDELIGHIAWRLLLPALFGLPLIGLWVWLATRQALSSLDDIARQIARRAPQQLQGLTPASAPEEIRTIIEALNDLFQRVDTALENERRFTTDAAHELRTPLAALLAQLHVALHARDEDERNRSLMQLQSGLARAVHLVDQMLQLARLDPESALPERRMVDLGQLAESVCAELGPMILARRMEFDLDATPGCQIAGHPEWLRVLLRNLLDNAIRYTPAGGTVRMTIARQDGAVTLAVSDNGPGIAKAERVAVMHRFHRACGHEEPGSGLGLSIVARIAELHGAALELADGIGSQGLSVRLEWPPTTPD
ncbi:MAG: two-component sensor histidine kinase [Betaproteobacteria bacterium]|nr:two-component sensor histidine kinase [Betaproteobacteria bacterium]